MTTLPLSRRTILAGAAFAGAFAQVRLAAAETRAVLTPAAAADIASLPRVKVRLVDPPFVHAHDQVASGGPKVVEFEITIEEKKITLDDSGAEVWASTFNGTVPGPMMVVHEGDYVELTLINPETNELMHNIDFHSATGALGGAALTQVNPGERAVLRWKATKPGVFVYHCAPPGMVAWHVVTGMNGAIMVLPRDGLKGRNGEAVRYDKVYYIGEQDFYLPRDADGTWKTYDSIGESYEDTLAVMRTLIPTHVVFNGAVGALTGDHAMTARSRLSGRACCQIRSDPRPVARRSATDRSAASRSGSSPSGWAWRIRRAGRSAWNWRVTARMRRRAASSAMPAQSGTGWTGAASTRQ